MAVGLWLALEHDPVAEVAVQVPIIYPVMENLEIASENVPQAQIRVRGPERIIRGLRASDVYAEVDLSSASAGERTFDLTAQQVHLPHGLEVVQVIPSQFHLTLDTRLTRQISVRPRVVGNFASGYSVDVVSAEPATISISGPRRRVEAVESAITDPVDASGTMERSTFITHAYVSDPLVQVVQPQPIRVTVTVVKNPAATGGR